MEEEKNHKKSVKNSDTLKWIIVALSGLVIFLLSFGMGVRVGGMKARYSYRWAENYHRNFGGPPSGFLGILPGFPQEEFIEGHGAVGEIIEVSDNSFVVKGRANVEKIVVLDEGTIINKGRELAEGLEVGEFVVVIGSPNEEGQIKARLIRIFDGKEAKLPYWNVRPLPFF